MAIPGQSQPTKVKRINGRLADQIKHTPLPVINTECDTIFSFDTVDRYPVGLAFDNINIYSAGALRHMIYKYNLQGQITDSIPYPGFVEAGGDMDFGDGFLWVVSEQERTAYKLNPANGDIITSFILPSSDSQDPDNYGCAYENGYLWVTEYFDKTLMRINATTGALVDSFFINREILPLKIIKGELYGIEFLDDTLGNFQLVKFDKNTGTAIESIPWCLEYPLGLTWADDHLWGLSSGFDIGPSRIYEFGNLLSSVDHTLTPNSTFTFFPNPATNNITVSSFDAIQWIEIYTVTGEKVFQLQGINQTNSYDIDLSQLQKGIYFMRVYDGSGFLVEKIVVQY